jgi:NADH-quinone oxidoreductase subunit L
MILAVGAVASGWFGIPAALGGSNRWAHFLEPVLGHPQVHLSHGAELGLMITSVVVGAAGIILAFFMYRKRPELPSRLASRFSGAYRVLLNKYYVDELYQFAIVKPSLWFSQHVLLRVIDMRGIEGVVNGLPRLIGSFAQRLRLLQDGVVSHYLAWMGGGVLVLLVLLLTRY